MKTIITYTLNVLSGNNNFTNLVESYNYTKLDAPHPTLAFILSPNHSENGTCQEEGGNPHVPMIQCMA